MSEESRGALLLVCLFVVGCGGSETRVRIDGGDVQAAIAAAAQNIDGDRALEFTTAAEVLALHAQSTATTPAARQAAAIAALNGKTPTAILAAYQALPADLQLSYAKQILLARGLKAQNDALETAMESPAFRDNPAYAAAVRAAREKQIADGLDGFWLADKLRQSPADLIAEFGPGQR